jgi:hypothetical protein
MNNYDLIRIWVGKVSFVLQRFLLSTTIQKVFFTAQLKRTHGHEELIISNLNPDTEGLGSTVIIGPITDMECNEKQISYLLNYGYPNTLTAYPQTTNSARGLFDIMNNNCPFIECKDWKAK